MIRQDFLHCRQIFYRLSHQGSPTYIYLYMYIYIHIYIYTHTLYIERHNHTSIYILLYFIIFSHTYIIHIYICIYYICTYIDIISAHTCIIYWVSLVAQWRIQVQCKKPGFYPWVRKIPKSREWLFMPVLLPGESHAHRSLAGSSPWGRRVGKNWVTNTFPFHFLASSDDSFCKISLEFNPYFTSCSQKSGP